MKYLPPKYLEGYGPGEKLFDPVNDRPNEIWGNDQVQIERIKVVKKPGLIVTFWWMLRLWFERKFLGITRDRIN